MKQQKQNWKVALIDEEGFHTLGLSFNNEAEAVDYVRRHNKTSDGYPRYTHFDMCN